MSFKNRLISWLGGVTHEYHRHVVEVLNKRIRESQAESVELSKKHDQLKRDCVFYANDFLRARDGHIVKSGERGAIKTDGVVCITGKNINVVVESGEIKVAPWLDAVTYIDRIPTRVTDSDSIPKMARANS